MSGAPDRDTTDRGADGQAAQRDAAGRPPPADAPAAEVPTTEVPGAEVPGAQDLSALTDALLAVIRRRGHRHFDEPVELASGELSHDFIDGKRALARGADLLLAGRCLLALAADEGVDFDAVGGLALGAAPLAHVAAVLSNTRWFLVRKQRKGRGTDQLVEGTRLTDGDRVLLVEDVVSTGGSIRRAHDSVTGTGAEVVLATALVDRGESARRAFGEAGVRYRPLLTYADLGIEPVGAP